MRIIPRRTKVKVEFYRNVSLVDLIIGVIGIGIELLLLFANFGRMQYLIMAVVLGVFVCLYLPVDGEKLYIQMGSWLVYSVSNKKFKKKTGNSKDDMSVLFPYKGIHDGLIEYDEYAAGVLEISPKEFRLLSEYKQNELIDKVFANVIKGVTGKTRASLVKIDRPIMLDDYIAQERKKKSEIDKTMESGGIAYEETTSRKHIIDDRAAILEELNGNSLVYKSAYYFVVYDSNPATISEILNTAISKFSEKTMECHRLNDKELAVFLKYNYTQDFDEREIEYYEPDEYLNYITPETVEFRLNKSYIDGKVCHLYSVRDYPLSVKNAWGYQIFNIPGTKVTMNIIPIEKAKAVRRIDKSLQELLAKNFSAFKASDIIDQQTHIDTLVELLAMLQNDNETLYEVNIHIAIFGDEANSKESLRKRVRAMLSEGGFKTSENSAKQLRAFAASMPSPYDNLSEHYRSIHASSIAAVFPFVLNYVMDNKGVLLGHSNGFPVIVDFFKRNNERVNSNMVIMGKSGSGKSFATKTLLTHLAAENSKIFILDPENEYTALAHNLNGKVLDVGTAKEGRLNPFHIITTLEADESADGVNANFSVHLQFLEEFFKQILVGISSDAMEYLNNIILSLYHKMGITRHTDLTQLSSKDYPTFDDLYALMYEDLLRIL